MIDERTAPLLAYDGVMRGTRSFLCGAMACLVAFGCGDDRVPPPVASVELDPGALLLGVDDSHAVTARALDGNGVPTDVPVTITSSDESVVEVTDGVAHAKGAVGSAVLTAQAGGVTSAPVIVTVARFHGQAVLYDDAQLGPITVVDSASRLFAVTVHDTTPIASGTVILAREATLLAGVVVDAKRVGDSTDVTFQGRPLTDLFDELVVDTSVPIAPGPQGSPRVFEPTPSVQLGPFDCGGAVAPPITLGPGFHVTVDPDLALHDHIEIHPFTPMVLEVSMIGQAHIEIEGEATLSAAFDGSVECTLPVWTSPPLNGAIGFVAGLFIDIDVGLSVEASVDVADVGVSVQGSYTQPISRTLRCAADLTGCSLSNDDGPPTNQMVNATPVVPAGTSPKLHLEIEPFARASLVATVFGGLLHDLARLDLLDLTVGIVAALDLASPTTQADDPNYAASAQLALRFDLAAGDSLQQALQWFNGVFQLDVPELVHDVVLAHSAEGDFTVSSTTAAPGDTVTFITHLTHTTFLGVPDVQQVEIYELAADGTVPDQPLAVTSTTDGTTYTADLLVTAADVGSHVYVAFVRDPLLSLLLEVSDDSRVTIAVAGCGDGQCMGTETAASCPADCPETCGDMLCTGSETQVSCAGDCGATSGWTSLLDTGVKVDAAAIDPVSPAIIYVGTGDTGHGLWASLDGGATFAKTAFPASVVGPIVVQAGTVYVGSSDGLYWSADHGATWTSDPGLAMTSVRAIAFAPSDPSTIYVGTTTGVERTTDGGANWAATAVATGVYGLAVDPANAQHVLAAVGTSLVYSSTDGFTSYAPATGFPAGTGVYRLLFDPDNGTHVFAATDYHGVYLSIDGGAAFASSPGVTGNGVNTLVGAPGAVYAGNYTSGVFKTTDGGATWTQINTGLTQLDVLALAIDAAEPNVLVAGTASGAFATSSAGM